MAFLRAMQAEVAPRAPAALLEAGALVAVGVEVFTGFEAPAVPAAPEAAASLELQSALA